ncbi:MAG: efflux RND transporter periplasmic adaptor subunit, partial [Planctomycetota bacterium]|nr:efflux RND transporter periplasmic adaptor subunit [Planctomycetota bacterium]
MSIDLGSTGEDRAREALDLLGKNSAWIEGLLARNFQNGNGNGNGAATKGSEKPGIGSEQLQIKGVLDLLATTLQADTFHSEATALVTELSTRLQCERVSIGFVHRQRIKMEAVSHSAEFGKKTNLVRAIESAMDEALDQESIIQHPEPSKNQSGDFRITRFHEVLARHTGSTQICSIPLALDSKIVAVLTLERQKPDSFSQQAISFCETACSLTGPYLELKRRDERGLFSKVADSGRFLHSRLTEAGYGAWKIAGGLLLAAIVFFTFAHGNYRIPAQTVLEGSIQQAAVAPFNGFIAEAPTRAGDLVEKGQVLCRLDDKDMALEHSRLQSRHQQLEKQYSQALALLNKAQVKIIGAQVRQAKAQLDQVTAQLEKIEVKAPFKGVIVDGDLSQSIGAPVERGDVLFQVAPLDSYRVIQEIDESDISHLQTGQAGEMVLSAFPSRRYPF